MQRGKELEQDAVWLYEQKNLTKVEDKERIYHPEYDFVSGEPDGLVGENGIIEIKCPKRKYHLANYQHGEQVKKYMLQMQGYLWITGRDWADFVSYDPRFPEGMRLSVHKVDRNQELIDKIEDRCVEFWETMVTPRLEEFDLLDDEIGDIPQFAN